MDRPAVSEASNRPQLLTYYRVPPLTVGLTTTRAAATYSDRCPPHTPAAAMDPGAMRRACVAFRIKLSRDTGVNLLAAACEALLGTISESKGR